MAASEIRALGNPFYRALNRLLEEEGFDEFAEETCRSSMRRSGVGRAYRPGCIFGCCWWGIWKGSARSGGLRGGVGTRFHCVSFSDTGWRGTRRSIRACRRRGTERGSARGGVQPGAQASGLLSGKTLGVDSTTLEANAAMRSIVRRDDGKGYEEWLEEVARASGIETPTRQDLAKLDQRPKKGSNREWAHPHDPEAITKMKDGRTGGAKFEQAVDMETGAVVAVTVRRHRLAAEMDEAHGNWRR